MSQHCPICDGKGIITTDCRYCRDCDSFEHSDLSHKTCTCCGDTGYEENFCPTCGGTGVLTISAE